MEEKKKRRRAGANLDYDVFTENKDENSTAKAIDIENVSEETIKKIEVKLDTTNDKKENAQKENKHVEKKTDDVKAEKKVADAKPETKKDAKSKEDKEEAKRQVKVDKNAKKEAKKQAKLDKKPKTKKQKIILSILITLYIILLGGVIFTGAFIGKKMALINIEKINKADLGIAKNVFDDTNMNITKEQFDQIKTIVVFGTDNRATSDEGSRSDVNMVVSINPNTKAIKMISIPRDTYVQINGSRDKMGHAYFYGGPQLAIKTINQNFGLNISEYVTIDFYGVIAAINKLGGVEVTITKEERDYINKWANNEAYGFSGRPYEELTAYGENTLLNGEQALSHARNRSIGNDFSRAERQRTIFTAVLKKLAGMDLETAMGLIDTMLVEVKTNVNVFEYTKFIPEIFANRQTYLSNIISSQVPATTDIHFESVNGLSCVVMNNPEKQKEIFRNYIYNM